MVENQEYASHNHDYDFCFPTDVCATIVREPACVRVREKGPGRSIDTDHNAMTVLSRFCM